MQNTYAKIVAVVPYADGSSAFRITADRMSSQGDTFTFDEQQRFECAYVPPPWNSPEDAGDYMDCIIGRIGKMVFAEDEDGQERLPEIMPGEPVMMLFLTNF